jgi:hypothetical protein
MGDDTQGIRPDGFGPVLWNGHDLLAFTIHFYLFMDDMQGF